MRVLFLPRYGAQAGSSRYMTYDYLRYFDTVGIHYTVNPILDDRYLELSRGSATRVHKLDKLGLHLAKQFFSRFQSILKAGQYDAVVLEKDVVPYMPYSLESLLFVLNHKVVAMYDERTDSYYDQHPNPWIRRFTKQKVERITQKAAHVIAWNHDVAEYAEKLNKNVTELSTGIDLERYRVKLDYEVKNRPVRIGWIGSPSGYEYLHDLDPIFATLARNYELEIYVVSSDPYPSNGFMVENRRWSVETEVEDLLAMDIGIMPLPNTEWAAGKSGCKMFQYMGVGLPVVVSPVGINAEVVKDGENGLIAESTEDWYRQLARLIENPELRQHLGRAGRRYVEEHNSQAANAEQIIRILTDVAAQSGSS